MMVDEDVTTRNDSLLYPPSSATNGDEFGRQHKLGANMGNTDGSVKRFPRDAIKFGSALFRRFTPDRQND